MPEATKKKPSEEKGGGGKDVRTGRGNLKISVRFPENQREVTGNSKLKRGAWRKS